MNQASPKRSKARFVLWGLLGGLFLFVLGLAVLFLYINYSSRNTRFVIEPDGIQIHGSMYGRTIPRKDLIAGSTKIVNLDTDKPYAPTIRTNGTSVPGYSEGWFRLGNGHKALLFVSTRTEVVYIPTTQGYAVMLSPTRPDFFLRSLKHGTSVPVTFAIVPSSARAEVCLLAAALLPVLIVLPILLTALRQHGAPTRPAEPESLYADRLVEITDDAIIFRYYYFPAGNKRVRFDEIDYVRILRLGTLTGKWRIWGSGDFRTWWPADWNRPSRDTGFLLVRKSKWTRIAFTVEDEETVTTILRNKGLLRKE